MKTISHWANRHVRVAILIIVLCEVFNAFSGLLLGMNLLEGWPIGGLLLLAVVVGGGAVLVRLKFNPSQPYAVARRWLFGAFLGNFLLFGVLGGLWAESIQTPTPNRAVWGSRRAIMRSDSVVKTDNLRSTNQLQANFLRKSQKADDQSGKRIGYVLLFLLSLGLAYVGTALACNLVCAGYGVLGVLVFVLGLGVLAGGIFYLIRAFDKEIVPLREMDKPKRRRTLRRFWISWLALIGGFIAWALVGAG